MNPRADRGARPFVEYRVTADKTSAYVGEEITLTYELLTQADVQGLEYLEAPKFPGLWAEDLEKPERPEGRRDVVDGKTVMRFTLLKKIVSGLTPGSVTVPGIQDPHERPRRVRTRSETRSASSRAPR